jgi:hypothetical protein
MMSSLLATIEWSPHTVAKVFKWFISKVDREFVKMDVFIWDGHIKDLSCIIVAMKVCILCIGLDNDRVFGCSER